MSDQTKETPTTPMSGKVDVLAVLWPERRNVPSETLLMWAKDAFANNEIEREPIDAHDAAALLHDAGLITLANLGGDL